MHPVEFHISNHLLIMVVLNMDINSNKVVLHKVKVVKEYLPTWNKCIKFLLITQIKDITLNHNLFQYPTDSLLYLANLSNNITQCNSSNTNNCSNNSRWQLLQQVILKHQHSLQRCQFKKRLRSQMESLLKSQQKRELVLKYQLSKPIIQAKRVLLRRKKPLQRRKKQPKIRRTKLANLSFLHLIIHEKIKLLWISKLEFF
jgi:hypothetical protein